MIPIFYINLDSRPDRRAFMEHQLAVLGLSAERITGIVHDQVPEEPVARIHRRGHLWRISISDLACGLSHQFAWRLMIQRNLDEALILEDDAVISSAILPYLAPGLLGRHGAGAIRLETRRQRVALGKAESDSHGRALRELGSTHKGTAAYLIRREIAEASLKHPLLNDMAVDRFLFGHGGPHLYRTRMLQADPAPVVQLDRSALNRPEARSDIRALRAGVRRKRRPRHRNFVDVVMLEASLLGPRLRQILRSPEMLAPKRLVAFVGDADANASGAQEAVAPSNAV